MTFQPEMFASLIATIKYSTKFIRAILWNVYVKTKPLLVDWNVSRTIGFWGLFFRLLINESYLNEIDMMSGRNSFTDGD